MKYIVRKTEQLNHCLIRLIADTIEEEVLLNEFDPEDDKQYNAISFHYIQAIKEHFGNMFELVAVFPMDDYPKSGEGVYKILTN